MGVWERVGGNLGQTRNACYRVGCVRAQAQSPPSAAERSYKCFSRAHLLKGLATPAHVSSDRAMRGWSDVHITHGNREAPLLCPAVTRASLIRRGAIAAATVGAASALWGAVVPHEHNLTPAGEQRQLQQQATEVRKREIQQRVHAGESIAEATRQDALRAAEERRAREAESAAKLFLQHK